MAASGGPGVDGVANPGWRFTDVGFFNWFALGLGGAAARMGSATGAAERARSKLAAGLGRGVQKAGRRTWQGTVCLLVAVSVGQATASKLIDPSNAVSGDCDLIATYTNLLECAVFPKGPIDLPIGECFEFRLLAAFEGEPDTLDVTDCLTTWTIPMGTDPDKCLVLDPPEPGNRVCVRPDAPASCVDKEFMVRAMFDNGLTNCCSDGFVRVVGPNLNKICIFRTEGLGLLGTRLYPADDELKTIRIVPERCDPRFPSFVIRLKSVMTDRNIPDKGPSYVILDDRSDPSSPEIVVQLRAALNDLGQRRTYKLQLEGTGGNGIPATGILEFDVSRFAPRAGGFYISPF
jgi:hypothetical protein